MAGTAGGDDAAGEPRELPLTRNDVAVLRRALTRAFDTEERSLIFLQSVGYPRERVPAWRVGSTASAFWALVFEDLANGVMDAPYRRLLDEAMALYATNPELEGLAGKYGFSEAPDDENAPQLSSQPGSEPAQPHGPQRQDSSHLVAWLDSAEQRDDLVAWLAERGLASEIEWSTPTSMSFRLSEADPSVVDRVMRDRTDIGWRVVAPGHQDYVLRYLSVEGPDGRAFRFNDVPSATPVSSVASELVEQYAEGLPGGDQATVVEHVGPDGNRRMNPDNTIGDEGVTEGSRLRVGFGRWTDEVLRRNPPAMSTSPSQSAGSATGSQGAQAGRDAIAAGRDLTIEPPYSISAKQPASQALGVLRLEIHGSWSVADLITLLRRLEDGYKAAAALESVADGLPGTRTARGSQSAPSADDLLQTVSAFRLAGGLRLGSIRYGSPGFLDVLGALNPLKTVKDGITENREINLRRDEARRLDGREREHQTMRHEEAMTRENRASERQQRDHELRVARLQMEAEALRFDAMRSLIDRLPADQQSVAAAQLLQLLMGATEAIAGDVRVDGARMLEPADDATEVLPVSAVSAPDPANERSAPWDDEGFAVWSEPRRHRPWTVPLPELPCARPPGAACLAISSQVLPVRTLAGRSATMSEPGRALASLVLTRIHRRSPVRVSAKPPASLLPRRVKARRPGSSRVISASPSSQMITVPLPRSCPSCTPSNSPACSS